MDTLCRFQETVKTYQYTGSVDIDDFKLSISKLLRLILYYTRENLEMSKQGLRNSMFAHYIQDYIIAFFCKVLNKQPITDIIYNDIKNYLQLPEVELNNNLAMDWGKIYWKVLHQSSIIVGTKATHLLDDYASLLINLHFILFCNICYNHYIALNPTCNIVLPMLRTKDPITWTFKLHNIINKNLKKNEFTIEEFCTIYNITIIDQTEEYIDILEAI